MPGEQACVDLLGASADLRTQVANTAMYHGGEILVRLAEIRSNAADCSRCKAARRR